MITILAIRRLTVQEQGFLPVFNQLLVQGVPGFLRLSLPESQALDEDSFGISYARDTKTIDHLFLPKPYSVKGIAHCVIFEDNNNFIVPEFVVYENNHGYERVIRVPFVSQKTMFSHITQSYNSSVQSTTSYPLVQPFLLDYSAEPVIYASASTSSGYGYGVNLDVEEVRSSSSYQQVGDSLLYQAERLVDIHTTYFRFDYSYVTQITPLPVTSSKTTSQLNLPVMFHPQVQDNQKQQYYGTVTTTDSAQPTTAVPLTITYLPVILSSLQTEITESVLAQSALLPAIESAFKTNEVLLVHAVQDAAPENYFSLTAIFDDKSVIDSVFEEASLLIFEEKDHFSQVYSKQVIDVLSPHLESSVTFTPLPSISVQTLLVPSTTQTNEISAAYVPSLFVERTSVTIDMVVQEVPQLANKFSLKQVVRNGKVLAGIQTLFNNYVIDHEELHDHFGLREVHKDGKTLEGILTMIGNYSVKRSDLSTNSSYVITAVVDQKTGAKKYVEIASNSALAVMDKLLWQLGANPQYKMTTFAAGGKIHQHIELRGIFEYDKEALSHFGVDTNAYVGMLGFVNGEEPELGTKPLHEITVKEGDTLSLAYVHQGVYQGGYGKASSSSVCLGTSVLKRARELGMEHVFTEQDAIVSGKKALGVVNHYVVQKQDIVSRQKEYAVNVIVNDKTEQAMVAGDSVLAVVDQMLYRNKIGLNVDARFNAAGQVYVRGVFERDSTAQQKLNNYDVKAVVDGKVVDDLVATKVKAGQDVSLMYVKR